MKKIIISSLVVIMALSVQQIWAQRSPSGKIDHLKTELDLNDDQVSQLGKMFESKHDEMKALRSTDDKTHEEKKEAMQSFRQAIEKEIEGILNEDQILKFQEMKKGREGKHGMEGKQMGHHQKLKDGKGEELHKQIKAYKEENIKPVMLEQRAKLEPKISEEDKQVIAEFRLEFVKMKAERQARFEEMKESGDAADFKKMHKERKGLVDDDKRDKMKSLVEKYKDDIEPLFAEVADQQEKWKNDIKAIAKSTLEINDEEIEHGKRKMRHMHGGHKEMNKMVHFLLLDPSEKTNTPSSQSLIKEVTAYPNPASSVTTIDYDVLEDGNVLIELRDNKGKLLKTVKNTFHEKGNHRVTILLDSYQSDLFYVLIQDKNGLATTKNIVRVR